MNSGRFQISIVEVDDVAKIPFELLLLGDPSRDAIDRYLKNSKVFIAYSNETAIGVVVLETSYLTADIKNIAVLNEFQGKGVGQQLLDFIIEWAKAAGKKTISIGTANSSIGQLYLYQKKGFEIIGIKQNFFIDNYPEPIYENGIQAKHMIVLKRDVWKDQPFPSQ